MLQRALNKRSFNRLRVERLGPSRHGAEKQFQRLVQSLLQLRRQLCLGAAFAVSDLAVDGENPWSISWAFNADSTGLSA